MGEKKLLIDIFQEEITDNGKDETIVRIGRHPTYGLVTDCISTRVPSLDRIIAKDIHGKWGIPCGRISFISGKPGAGKTTLCLTLTAETQARGGLAYYIDSEHRVDRPYAERLGVKIDDLFYKAPQTLEDALESIERTIKIVRSLRSNNVLASDMSKIPVLIITDSLNIATRAEKVGELGKGGKGEHARIMSEFFRKITSEISDLNIAIVFVCQIKSKLNIGYGGGRGPKETFLAEDTLRFHCTIGLRVQRISTLKDKNNERFADIDLFATTKNSCLPPFQEAEAELQYGIGYNYYASLNDTLIKYYGVEVKGSWYSHPDIGKWQGKDGLRKLLEKDLELQKVVNKILSAPVRVTI